MKTILNATYITSIVLMVVTSVTQPKKANGQSVTQAAMMVLPVQVEHYRDILAETSNPKLTSFCLRTGEEYLVSQCTYATSD